jgi:hypothetical protein
MVGIDFSNVFRTTYDGAVVDRNALALYHSPCLCFLDHAPSDNVRWSSVLLRGCIMLAADLDHQRFKMQSRKRHKGVPGSRSGQIQGLPHGARRDMDVSQRV